MVATAASTIHFFTGNNIGPKGDLASRSLHIRLTVDQADPENREFKHSDVIGWTDSMRAEIISALYTILMGNPFLKQPRDAACKTRFKMWWRLVGSAVEHAAMLFEPESPVDFQSLFLAQDDEDEDSTSLAEALEIMLMKWMGAFDAADVAKAINGQPQDRSSPDQYGAPSTPDPNSASLREFLFPAAPLNQVSQTRNQSGGACGTMSTNP